MKYTAKLASAFTLIELLVVMGIIGILIAMSAFGLQNARATARDASRKSDLEAVRSALELYRSDNDTYPVVVGWNNVSDPASTIYGMLVPNYISKMPVDPRNNNQNPACPPANTKYGYFYRNNGNGYQLIAGLEKQTTSNCPNWCGGGPASTGCYIVVNP